MKTRHGGACVRAIERGHSAEMPRQAPTVGLLHRRRRVLATSLNSAQGDWKAATEVLAIWKLLNESPMGRL